MAISCRVPGGLSAVAESGSNTGAPLSQTVTIESADPVAAGDLLLVWGSSEGASTGGTHTCPDPIQVGNINFDENGGLHPASHTVSNVTDSGTNPDLSSNADSRWMDFGYAAGGYTSGDTTGIGRNQGGVWVKVLTAADILAGDPKVSVTLTVDRRRRMQTRLMVISGASIIDDDLATMINIATSTMAANRGSGNASSDAYPEVIWLGPDNTSGGTGDPSNQIFDSTQTITSNTTLAFAAAGGSDATITASTGTPFTGFVDGKVISVTGSEATPTNNGLYRITGPSTPSDTISIVPVARDVVTAESAGPSITIKSGGYTEADMGDDFLPMWHHTQPSSPLPNPAAAVTEGGAVRPSNEVGGTAGDWNDGSELVANNPGSGPDDLYPAGFADGSGTGDTGNHGYSWYWEVPDLPTADGFFGWDTFTTFNQNWDGDTGHFRWDMTTNNPYPWCSQFLMFKTAAGAVAGTPVTITTSYAVETSDTQTLTTSYAVKTTATPETITTSYAVKTTGTPQTITTSYDVALGDTQTLTTSYAVESGNTQTLTTSYAVKTTGDAETITTSYAVKLDGIETITTSYAVTSEDSATITTSYAMAGTTTPGSATLTTSYAVETSDTETVTTSYAVEVTGNTETLTTSYAVQLSPAGETITAAYAVVTSQGPSVSLNTSYKVSDTATPETVTTSYSVSIPAASPEVVVVKSLDMIPVGSVEQNNVHTLTFEPEEDQSQFAGQQLILIVGGVGGTRAGGSSGSTFDTTFEYPGFNAYFDDEGSDQEVASEVFVVAHASGGRWRGTLSWMGVRTITSSEPPSYSFTVNFDRDVGSNFLQSAGNIAGGILIRVNNVVDAFTGATKNWLLTATSKGNAGNSDSQVGFGSNNENFTGENNLALLFAGLDRIYSDAATGGASFTHHDQSLAKVELYDDGLEGTGAQSPTEQQSFAQAYVGYYLTPPERTRTTLFYNAEPGRLPANNRRRNISLLEIPLSGVLPRPTTLGTSYSVVLDNQETITTSYAVSTSGHVADDNLTTNYAVEAGNEKTVTASYAVKTTGTPETVTTSYDVEAPGTEKTLSTSYVVESGHEEEISTSYAITTNTDLPCSYGIKVDGLATVTASYGIKISDEQTVTTSYDVGFVENVAKITTSYAITGVTYAGTAAELHTKYAVINEAHLGYKAFRQLSTLRQKVK